jgi:undecaprenyl-diphosphatase
MQHYLDYVILGLVQGVTEFLPISSDGHLVIVGRWLQTTGNALALAVFLHLGSLGAVVWTFRRDLLGLLRRPDSPDEMGGPRLLGLIALSTVPAVIFGSLLHSFFAEAFQSVPLTGGMLILTGLVLLSTRAFPSGSRSPGVVSALAMGVAQVFALLPGISRSAMTLATGFALGVERVRAVRFSFLMAVPAIAGANAFELMKLGGLRGGMQVVEPFGVGVGILAAFLSGLVAIRALLALVRRGRFEWFGLYCLLVGLVLLFLG